MQKLKYHIMIEWPATCRNRSERTLKSRPDLVFKINEFTTRVIDICKKYKQPIQVDQNYNMLGIKTWWANGEELYHFLMTQDQNSLHVIPELGVVNGLSGSLMMFKFQVLGTKDKKDSIIVY